MSARTAADAATREGLSCEALRELRGHFPMLGTEENGRPLVYLDNAATMQVPDCVQEAVCEVWRHSNANVHRGAHYLSQKATDSYEEARRSVADFAGFAPDETILTSGTTDGLNRLAAMLEPMLCKGDQVVVTGMEHHSNLLPWRHAAQRAGAEVVEAPVASDGSFDAEGAVGLIGPRTKVVAVTQLSNVSGIEVPLSRIAEAAHAEGALLAVDGAQGIAHLEPAGGPLPCDAYAFSGHKLGAPTGTGALCVRRGLLDRLQPATFGGGAVASVGPDGMQLREGVGRFEQGTPNFQGVAGLAAAVGFWASRDRHAGVSHEAALLRRFAAGVADIPGVHVVAPQAPHAGTVSVWLEKGTSYDACKLLDAQGVATRSGLHCAQPYLDAMGLGAKGVLRVSVAPYNTSEEIDACLDALEAAVGILGR